MWQLTNYAMDQYLHDHLRRWHINHNRNRKVPVSAWTGHRRSCASIMWKIRDSRKRRSHWKRRTKGNRNKRHEKSNISVIRKKIKKYENNCWQTMYTVVSYRSCVWEISQRSQSCQKEMKKVLDNSWSDVIRCQSCCERETKTTSKKLKKVLDRQETTWYNSKAVWDKRQCKTDLW